MLDTRCKSGVYLNVEFFSTDFCQSISCPRRCSLFQTILKSQYSREALQFPSLKSKSPLHHRCCRVAPCIIKSCVSKGPKDSGDWDLEEFKLEQFLWDTFPQLLRTHGHSSRVPHILENCNITEQVSSLEVIEIVEKVKCYTKCSDVDELLF